MTNGWDESFHEWTLGIRSPGLTSFMRAATHLGGTWEVDLAVLVAVVAAGVWLGKARRGLVILATLAACQITRYLLNDAIARPRPPRADWLTDVSTYSMPSGHSSNVAVGVGLIIVALWPIARSRSARSSLIQLGALIVLTVGFSRVYLGVHWPTDVLAGWAFGLSWVVGAVFLIRRLGLAPTR